MKANTLYLAELYVGKCKIAHQLPPKISLSFRIGKNMTQATHSRTAKDGELNIDATLQLNTDQLALDTQRCSLTLSSIALNGQITVIGMTLIPLSKEIGQLSKKLRLAQCPDKSGEVQITLNITPLDSILMPEPPNIGITMRSSGVSSNRSLMEMQEFDKKMISPPKLFNFVEKEHKLQLPKPRSAKQLSNQTEDLRESVSKLQNECDCLKELLRVEIKKGDASNKIIDSLVNALEEVNNSSHHTQLDETLLLDGIQKDQLSIDKVHQRNVELEKQISSLRLIIDQLRAENKNLQQKTSESTRISSRQALNSLKEIAPRQESFMDSNKKVDNKQSTQISQLEVELLEKFEQLQRFKKKMKLTIKIPGLQSPQIQKQGNPLCTMKQIMDRIINNNRELMKALLRYIKLEADSQSDGFLGKIRQKIDRTFGSLIAKKMNRDIILYEKGELVKAVEDLWQKCA